MRKAALRHFSFYPFVQPLARNRVKIYLEAEAGDLTAVTLVYWKRTAPQEKKSAIMEMIRSDSVRDHWTVDICFDEEGHYIKYGFSLLDSEGTEAWLGPIGISTGSEPENCFEILQINETDVLRIPEWAKGTVYYQIFPDRFERGADSKLKEIPWNSEPTRENYLGGTLNGIRERLDYLQELGIECIYLNPIFKGDFNHRYATTDYFTVEPGLGTLEELQALVSEAHGRGMRVLLDGVFNHTGIHFEPFKDLKDLGSESQFRDWFYVKSYPVQISAECYECVGDYPYMPRLNGANPDVRSFVSEVLLYWIDVAHIDGWRLDVADELDRHAVVQWRDLIKRKNPNLVLLCETWGDAGRLVGPDAFDCAMNYRFRDAMVAYFARQSIDESELADRLEHIVMNNPWDITLAMYNCIGSHDTARFLTEAKGNRNALMLAMAFQMLFPGAPAVYYGDEIGMTGENDPGCRGGMAWNQMDQDILEWQRRWIWTRKKHSALRKGSFVIKRADTQQHIFAFERADAQECILCIFNTDIGPHTLDFTDMAESVHVPQQSVEIIIKQREDLPCSKTGNT